MKYARHILSGMIIAGFLLAATASSSDKDTEAKISKTEANAPAIDITAMQLSKDYIANEVSADQKYKDKVLSVTGTVTDIAKDMTDGIYVVLAGPEDDIVSVQCSFADDHTDETAALKKGQKITIKGLCDGKMMNVHLSGSSLVK